MRVGGRRGDQGEGGGGGQLSQPLSSHRCSKDDSADLCLPSMWPEPFDYLTCAPSYTIHSEVCVTHSPPAKKGLPDTLCCTDQAVHTK